jgi:uncharacterized protein YdaU (DUF1376 family)
MHYYQFNIGDYQSHTAHLTDTEDLAYRRLLDWYYLHEHLIPLDLIEVSRQIRMRTHSDCIASVLREYFERTDEGWIHHRANKEIAKVGEKSEKAAASAKARWNKPKDANALRTQSKGNATQDTLPNTQDTLPKKNTVAPPFGVTDSVWQDWLKLRKAKKAAVTQTAIDGIQREADKAGVSLQTVLEMCCERGWTGFKAEWLQPKQSHGYQDKNLGAARAIFGDERKFNALQIT